MRKEQIDLSVEYCETAPLAYGVEPNTTPHKIKFLSLEPSTWMTEYEVLEIVPPKREGLNQTWRIDSKRRWVTTVQQARLTASCPESDRYGFPRANDLKVGDTFLTYDATLKGFLPVLRWRNRDGGGGWDDGLCPPAAVHRTWSAHVAEVGEQRAERLRRQIANAPVKLAGALVDAIEAAVLILDDTPGSAKTGRDDIRALILDTLNQELDRESRS
jgi:hypothetical protein